MTRDDESKLLDVSGLTVRFGGFTAVDHVSLTVSVGESVGLIGPNGAGKTTCFNAISGFQRADEGEVWVSGSRLRSGDAHGAWRSGLARTFQRLELFWSLTVREHVELAHRYSARRNSPTAAVSVDEVLELVGITAIADEIAVNLPLGVCRLVELARALAARPKLLLLDEPSSGLDRDETKLFDSTLRATREATGVAILLVEHDVEFVMGLAQRVYVLDFGRIIASGRPAEIQDSELVRSVYLGGDAGEALSSDKSVVGV